MKAGRRCEHTPVIDVLSTMMRFGVAQHFLVDVAQAHMVQALVREYLPHLAGSAGATTKPQP